MLVKVEPFFCWGEIQMKRHAILQEWKETSWESAVYVFWLTHGPLNSPLCECGKFSPDTRRKGALGTLIPRRQAWKLHKGLQTELFSLCRCTWYLLPHRLGDLHPLSRHANSLGKILIRHRIAKGHPSAHLPMTGSPDAPCGHFQSALLLSTIWIN